MADQQNFATLQQHQAAVLQAFAKYDGGKLSATAFCNELTSFGLHLTGTFHLQLKNRQLTRANLFRSLLRATLSEPPLASHVAGMPVEFGNYTVAAALAESPNASAVAASTEVSREPHSNSQSYWHAQMYAHSNGNGDLIDEATPSLAGSEFEQFPTECMAPEVQEALKVFCEEQVDGARLRRYLHNECGMALTDEQVHVINRQEVSGRRNLRQLCMVFAPNRLKRDGFTKLDSAPSHERERAKAAADIRKSSPPPAGAPSTPDASFSEIRMLSQKGTGSDMLRFDEKLPLVEPRRQLGAPNRPNVASFDPTAWKDAAEPRDFTAPGGVRTGIDVFSAGHHGDIFSWEGPNTKIPPQWNAGKQVVPGAATLSGVQVGSMIPSESHSIELRHEFGTKASTVPEFRSTRPGQESSRDLCAKNSYPVPPDTTHVPFSRSRLDPTPADAKRVRNVGPKPAAAVIDPGVHSFAVKNFPLDASRRFGHASATGNSTAASTSSARLSSAQSAPWGTDANVDSPAMRNIIRPRAGEMTPTRIYEALSTGMRRM